MHGGEVHKETKYSKTSHKKGACYNENPTWSVGSNLGGAWQFQINFFFFFFSKEVKNKK